MLLREEEYSHATAILSGMEEKTVVSIVFRKIKT